MLNNMNPNSNDPNNNVGGSSGGGMPTPMFPYGPMGEDENEFDPKEYLVNYNEKFAQAQPTMFRDEVIQQTLSCLIGKFKPNALLVGPAGVGKTKIIEDIARRIATNDALIPDQLQGYTIWELPLSNIVAGSGIVGEVERKTKDILKFAQDPKNKVILFMDEIHILIDGNPTYDKIAQILKPALARGDMKAVGATTSQEAQNLMHDPAFNRRFTRIIVDELSRAQTKEILKQIAVPMFTHYNNKIAINDKIIDEVIITADEFKTMGSHRPDNAITLLDRAMADAFINRKVLEHNAQEANDQATLSVLNATPTVALSKSQLKQTAMKLMTGNNKKEVTDIAVLRRNLSVIKGQDDVLEEIIDYIRRDELNLYPRKKPLSFLITGDPGIGKTYAADIVAETMTGIPPITLNMTQFSDTMSLTKIVGSSAGYIGSDSKAELPFDILETNPYQVILLDEFEKAHRAVQRLFMSALEKGYIKTARGKIVDFSKAIIFATTNAGHSEKGDAIGFSVSGNGRTDATTADLTAHFDKEMLRRFTKVFNFHSITEDTYDVIMRERYAMDIADIKSRKSSCNFLPDELSDEAVEMLHKKSYDKNFGAGPVRDTVKAYIEDLVFEHQVQMASAASDMDNIIPPDPTEPEKLPIDGDTIPSE